MKIDGIVDDWLQAEAPTRAPEPLLRATLVRVGETPQQRVLWRRHPRDGVKSSRPLLVLVAVLVGASLLGTLAILGALNRLPQPIETGQNGWVAFTAHGTEALLTTDIYIAREGQPARRIVGSDADGISQRCPAFGPDGAQLAYGRAAGSDYGDAGHSGAALVVADLDARGDVATAMEVEVGGSFRPPCAIWSPDGRYLAFAAGRSVDSIQSGFTTTSSEVWIVRLADQRISRVEVFATDLEWSPDGGRLAIASGTELSGHNADLSGDEIRLYSVDSGETRMVPGTRKANWVTWSHDGSRIAYERTADGPNDTGRVDPHRELVVHELDGDAEQVAASDYSTSHGIGPVWSPIGDEIVYQRICEVRESQPTGPCREEHDVVVITAGPGSSWRASDVTEVVLPQSFPQGDSDRGLWPFRVTWSPDGRSLLYVTFGDICPACAAGNQGSFPSALVVVPTSPGQTPVLLAEGDNIDSEASGLAVPIQVWGRQPERNGASLIPD